MVRSGVAVAMLVGMVACGGSDDNKKVLGGAADLVVTDKLPFYKPAALEIGLNKAVTFTVFNDGKKLHNVTIPGFAIDMDVEPGKRIEIKLPAVAQAPRDGFFTFYSKYNQANGESGRINISR